MTDRRLYAEDGVTLLNEDPADTTALFLDGSYGDVALAPAFSGDGFVLVSGAAALTFAAALAGHGTLADSGTGALTFGLALSGAGTVSGSVVAEPTSTGQLGRVLRNFQTPPAVVGSGAVAFAFHARGSGYVTDDELVLALAA